MEVAVLGSLSLLIVRTVSVGTYSNTEEEKPILRAQEPCDSRGGRPGLPVPNGPYGLCGRKVTLPYGLCGRKVTLPYGLCGRKVALPYGLCGRKVTLPYGLCGRNATLPYGLCGRNATLNCERELGVHVLMSCDVSMANFCVPPLSPPTLLSALSCHPLIQHNTTQHDTTRHSTSTTTTTTPARSTPSPTNARTLREIYKIYTRHWRRDEFRSNLTYGRNTVTTDKRLFEALQAEREKEKGQIHSNGQNVNVRKD